MRIQTLLAAALAIAAFSLFQSHANADQWNGWRGPSHDGHSKETGLKQAWDTAPRQLLRIDDLGSGYGSICVAGKRFLAIGNEGLENEFVQARDTASGKLLWKTRLGKVGNPDQQPSYPASRSTPVVDGNRVYALGSDGDLACLDIADGTVRWRKQLRTDFGGAPGTWAYSETPLIDGNRLVVTPGGPTHTLVALDKSTGALVWKTGFEAGGAAAYASPIPATIAGTKHIVQYVRNALIGVDAATGAVQWKFERTADPRTGSNIGTPVVHADGVYGAASLVGAGLATIVRDNTGFIAKSAYFDRALPSAIGGIVRIGNHGYGANGQTFVCFDWATGAIRWSERGVGAGAMVVADNRIFLHKENGDVALIEPSPDAYKERGRFTPDGQPQRGRPESWAYPALSDGRLYVRDHGMLWVYDVRTASR